MRALLNPTLVYFASSVAARGISFLLTPLYTRKLGIEDYGVLSLANTVVALSSLLLGFGLHASISRLWFETERKDTLISTITWFLLVVPPLLLLVPLDPFKLLPRDYFQLVLLQGWLSVFHALPQTIFVVSQQPRKVAWFNLALVIAQVSAALVGVHYGVGGVLWAGVASSALLALVSLLLVRPSSAFDPTVLKQALVFSLPLVPHLVSNWFLSLSDRVLLEQVVSPAALGAYSLAYTFSSICSLFCTAVLQALSPLVTRLLKSDPAQVPWLGELSWYAICAFALGVALMAPAALPLLAPRGPFDEALVYVPWVVLGAAFQGAYFIVSQGTWFSMRTGWVGPITVLAALGNFLANLWLIPRYGAWAAAVNTAAGYALLALLHARLAHALFPIRWPYLRALSVGAACVGVYVATR